MSAPTNLPPLLDGVPTDYVLARVNAAAGDELASGKFVSPESSSALAINCFAWFHPRPALLPPFPGIAASYPPQSVDIEECVRFPWAGGMHPWLDAVIRTPAELIGVESKRYEPFRDKKNVDLSPAYDRPVWGDAMGSFERMRDDLRSGALRYQHLDATQLLKHAFGLTTQARRAGLKPVLIYLYAEPTHLSGRALAPKGFERHRAEIADFAARVAGADVAFHALSYRAWLETWSEDDAVRNHAAALVATFAP